jgi:16S rRNA (guanine527-N7)-methyltransferase
MVHTLDQDVQAMLPLLREIHEQKIADIGSGSGLPAIPLKIIHPESQVVLIERSGKKCTFLRHVIDLLGMEGLDLIEADLLKSDIRKFDAVLARSFSPISTLQQAVSRILGENGRFYYLFTGNNSPDLGPQFRRDQVISRECRDHTLTLARFILAET